jgi:NDP-sugar pyrophosphorylase family protein
MRKCNHALIMAAGRGARMMPLTEVIPKPMVPYRGTTLVAEGIKNIRKHFKNIHITVGYKGTILAKHVVGLGVNSVFDTNGKGNAWWIYNTMMKYLAEPLIVLTCDNVVELEFVSLINEYYHFDQPACMVVPVKPVPGLDGDYIFHENNVVTKLDRDEISEQYCSGIQVLNPKKINDVTNETEDFRNLWGQLIAQRQVYASRIHPEKWFAVDTLDQLNKLNSTIF